MSEDQNQGAAERATTTEAPIKSDQPKATSPDEPPKNFWMSVVEYISIFGAFWPFGIFLLNLVIPDDSQPLQGLSWFQLLSTGAYAFLLEGITAGLGLAMFSSFFILLVDLICRSVGIRPEQLLVGSLAGACVGLMISLPYCLKDSPSNMRCILLISTATLLTQSGGTWGAWRVLYGSKSASTVVAELPRSMRFGVRHLLLISIWCAVVLTTLKYLGVLSERLMGLVGIWLVLQAILVLLTMVFVTRLRRNWGNLQEGSFEQ